MGESRVVGVRQGARRGGVGGGGWGGTNKRRIFMDDLLKTNGLDGTGSSKSEQNLGVDPQRSPGKDSCLMAEMISTMAGSHLGGGFMRSFLVRLAGIVLLVAALAVAQTSSPQPPGPPPRTQAPAASDTHPAPKFDIAHIDKTLDPCVDFY